MREILFRGIGKISEEWEKGYLVIDEDTHTIITIDEGLNFLEVIPETVGQYTGIKDKNGNKLFEGDILEIKKDFDFLEFKKGDKFEVVYAFSGYRVKKVSKGNISRLYLIQDLPNFEITGNIHEREKDDYK